MTCPIAYNFDRFKISHFDFEAFHGPKEGEDAIDFQALTLEGKPVQFFDLFDQEVVLSCGSYSCPYFAGQMKEMNRLQKQYPRVRFLVLYTREAHPGGKIAAHKHQEDKLLMARMVSRSLKEKRVFLVDDLLGSAHQKYGALPNAVYIIDSQKRVLYRDAWESPERIDVVLKHHVKGESITRGEILKISRKRRSIFYYLFKTILSAGFIGLFDLTYSALFEVKGDLKKVKLD